MITWVTVWVLTVYQINGIAYQLTYDSKNSCAQQIEKHKGNGFGFKARCDFQQIPVVTK